MAANEQQQSRLKELITKGREQGFLTYAEVNDHLPQNIADPDQVEDIIGMINDMGITVSEQAPDAETLLMTDGDSTDEAPLKKLLQRWQQWKTRLAARLTLCVCICAKWVP